MARTILFRGRTAQNEWIFGDLSQVTVKSQDGEEQTLSYIDGVCVDTLSVGQYSGLKDKNGELIFEGDVVRTYVEWAEKDGELQSYYRAGVIAFISGGFHMTKMKYYGNPGMDLLEESQPDRRVKNNFPAYRSLIVGNVLDGPTVEGVSRDYFGAI